LEAQSYIEEERIAEAFDRLDSDDSGYISKKNLRQFLGNNTTSKQIDDIIREGDANGDGKRK
jgi:calcium-dependent protein kinase